jgi:hypothetical protein
MPPLRTTADPILAPSAFAQVSALRPVVFLSAEYRLSLILAQRRYMVIFRMKNTTEGER